MKNDSGRRCRIAAAVALLLTTAAARAAPVTTFAPDGTAHIVDLTVPIPTTISPEARAMLQTVGYEKMASIYSAIRLLGVGDTGAMIAQAGSIVLAGAAVAYVWNRRADAAERSIVLIAGAICASPLVLDYDLVMAAVAGAWFIGRVGPGGFAPWEKTLIAAMFAAPLVSRPLGLALHAPLSSLVCPLMMIFIIRHVRVSRE